MHAHRCPRCNRDFQHQRFVYAVTWNAMERIVARALHRFYGACSPCIRKFIEKDFGQDNEIQGLRTTVMDSGGVLFSTIKIGPSQIEPDHKI